MRIPRLPLSLLTAALLLSGCDELGSLLGPGDRDPPDAAARSERAVATLLWNEFAREGVARNRPNQFAAWRLFAYLTVAQYNAVVAAEDAKAKGAHASAAGAVAGASAEVLAYAFPADTALIAALVRTQAEAGSDRAEFAAGEAVGRAVGAGAAGRARTDRFVATWTGTVPTCPGCWFSSASPAQPPALPLLGQMRPFFLSSGDQFRPPPPPAFGSPAFAAALAEVRAISDGRTAEQTAIAERWALATGTLVSGYWNEEAARLIDRYALDERRAAHALALTNMASMDALIACHDAKYAYWLLRPVQADPGIRLAIAMPNFPAYPSNHACASGTAAAVLASRFPAERTRLDALADEAALSRVLGGIHYRFDADAGLEIGRKVAALAGSLDVNGHRAFPL